MTQSESGTLGSVQLLSFTHDASSEAIGIAAGHLKLTKTEIRQGTVSEATAYLAKQASPETLLVEVTSVEKAADELDALADVLNPATKVIVTGTIDSMRFYHWLMEIGIHEYLLAPFTETELVQALKAKVDPSQKTQETKPKEQKLVAVIGARGGVGTTTVAVNLAAMLARDHAQETALFDLDAYFGSVALTLDVEPGRGFRDAMEKPDRVDGLFLDRVMVKPFPNLSVLSAEEPLTETLTTQATAGETILAALRSKFPFIVVDVPRQMSAFSRYILAQADYVIVVAEPQLGSLRDALRIKDYLTDGLKRPAPVVLLNRVGMAAKHELPLKDFAKHYGQAPKLILPYMLDAVAATADGTLLIDNPKAKPALAPLASVAAKLVGSEAPLPETKAPAASTSLFAKLRKK